MQHNVYIVNHVDDFHVDESIHNQRDMTNRIHIDIEYMSYDHNHQIFQFDTHILDISSNSVQSNDVLLHPLDSV